MKDIFFPIASDGDKIGTMSCRLFVVLMTFPISFRREIYTRHMSCGTNEQFSFSFENAI